MLFCQLLLLGKRETIDTWNHSRRDIMPTLFKKNGILIGKYKTRQWLGLYPSLFFPTMRLVGSQPTRDRLLSPETELVIEGFPRSSNTFALVAFELAQSRPVKLAHHLHAPAQIIRAVQWQIPSLVVIRNPEDAVLSMIVFSSFPAKDLLEAYYLFYKSVLPYSHGFVCATFDEITTDYGSIIQKINERFGTNFDVFKHTKENLDRCFQVIDAKDMRFTGRETVSKTMIARQSPEKEVLKEKYKNVFADRKSAFLLEKCRRIHEELLAICQT